MNKLKLICTEFISVNHYMSYRCVIKKKGNKPYGIVMPFKPAETKNFEKKFGEYAKIEATKQGWIKPEGGFIIMDTTFYFPRIDMDPQNYFKSICDILTNVGIWEDDNIVQEHVNRIYYDNKNPRIEIEIYESDVAGIFDTKEEYNEFRSHCITCNRFKRNCSIHNKILESRIHEDVIKDNKKWKCLKYKKLK